MRVIAIVLLVACAPARAVGQATPRAVTLGPLPDLRIDHELLRARAAAEAARPERALAIVEALADQPRCPTLLWDRDQALELIARIGTLPNPHTNHDFFVAGIPLLAGGGALTLITGLVYAFDGLSVGLYGSSSGPRSIPVAGYGTLWALGGALVVTGIAFMIHGSDVSNPPFRAFEERRRRLRERIGPPDEMDPVSPLRAFDHPACSSVTVSAAPARYDRATRSAGRATALACTRTRRSAHSRGRAIASHRGALPRARRRDMRAPRRCGCGRSGHGAPRSPRALRAR